MTEKRFTFNSDSDWWTISDTTTNDERLWGQDVVDLLNELAEEKKELQFQCNLLREQSNEFHRRAIENANRVGQLEKENKELKKQLHLMHMSSMFSTVKSFKGDVSERYDYSEETDTLYDTANTYGQYYKILDKKEVCMLLIEYETLLNNGDVE